jgi:hypothetical protein
MKPLDLYVRTPCFKLQIDTLQIDGFKGLEPVRYLNGISLANRRRAGAQCDRNGKFEEVPIQPITGLAVSLDP